MHSFEKSEVTMAGELNKFIENSVSVSLAGCLGIDVPSQQTPHELGEIARMEKCGQSIILLHGASGSICLLNPGIQQVRALSGRTLYHDAGLCPHGDIVIAVSSGSAVPQRS